MVHAKHNPGNASPPAEAEGGEARRTSSSRLLAALRYLVAVGLIVVLLAVSADPGATIANIATIDPKWLVVGLFALFAAIMAGSLRWMLLLRGLGFRPPLLTLARLWLTGFFFDNLLPSTIGGDVARGYGLSRYGVSTRAIVTTLLVGRLMGFVALGTWGALSLLSAAIRSSSVLALPNILGGCLGTAGLAVLVAAVYSRGPKLKQVEQIDAHAGWVTKARSFAYRLWNELRTYRNRPSILLWCLGISLAMWLIDTCVLFACIRGLGEQFGYGHVIGLNTTLNWAGLIPVSVGGAGVQEGTLVMLMREFAIGGSLALAVGLSYRAVRVTVALTGGLVLLVTSLRTGRHRIAGDCASAEEFRKPTAD